MTIKELAAKVQPEVVAFRRDLHRHPEPSLKEFRTTEKIAEKLDEMGIPYRRMEPTGIIAEIKGGKPGKRIALRADMDALSMQEKSGVDFSSEVPGMMHACGHDTHVAMLIGAARILNDMKEDLCGNVRLVFQAAEETADGAKLAVKQGVLEGVDAIFGIHITPLYPCGCVATHDGVWGAGTDYFRIWIEGKTSHGSMPEAGADATVAAAAAVMNLQTIVSREICPTEPAVVSVGMLQSGTRFNIISGEAYLEGTVRTMSRETQHSIPKIMERIVKNTVESFRCKMRMEYDFLIEVLMNDPEMTELIRNSAAKIVDSPELVQDAPPSMGGEDFSQYSLYCKSGFAMLGAGGKYPPHSDHFEVNEDSFITGVALHVQTALDFLSDGENRTKKE